MSGTTAARTTDVEAGSGRPNVEICAISYIFAEFSSAFSSTQYKDVATGYGAPAGSGEGEESSGDDAAAARAEDDYAGESIWESSYH